MAVTVPAWGAHSRQSSQRVYRSSAIRGVRPPGTRPNPPSDVRGGRGLPASSRAARAARMRAQAVTRGRSQSATGFLSRNAVVVGIAVLLAVLVMLLPGLSAQASDDASESPAQSLVTVRQGDSLWTVAQRSMPQLDTRSAVIELRKANGLKGSDLVVGQQLVVPTQ